MALLTVISRVSDGLPLSASVEKEPNQDEEYNRQAKMITRQLNAGSPPKCSVETGSSHTFHYVIQNGVVFLTLCERAYPRKLAFAYLGELAQEFERLHGPDVNRINKPYAFIKFDTYIQKIKRLYQDSRTQRNLAKLNGELQSARNDTYADLQDVQRGMEQTIEEVLARGEKLDTVSHMSSKLMTESRKYARQAKQLNLQVWLKTYGPMLAVLGIVVLFIMIRVYIW